MRQIIFRGKRADNGKWIYGWYIKANIHWHKYGVHKDWIVCNAIQNGGICNVIGRYAVIPETVGQFIGLTDKNGTKIFEGDIVDILTENEELGKIEYNDGGFWVEADGFCLNFMENINGKDVEVIGNIYDNPELLEVEE